MRRVSGCVAALAVAIGLAACGGTGGSGGGVTVVNGSIAYFVVRSSAGRDTVSVLAGSSIQLSGKAYDSALEELALVGDTTWVSRDTSIAKVDLHGVVSTSAVGNVWVLGTFTPKNSSFSYTDSALVQAIGPT